MQKTPAGQRFAAAATMFFFHRMLSALTTDRPIGGSWCDSPADRPPAGGFFLGMW